MLSFYIFVLSTQLAKLCFANSIYVAPDGGPTGSGTLTEPYNSLSAALNVAKPGDNIFLRGGTFKVGSRGESVSNVNGLPNQPITIQPYMNEKPIFDGSNGIQQWECIIKLNQCSYISITGIIAMNSASQGVCLFGDHISMTNSFVNNTAGIGIQCIGDSITVDTVEASYLCWSNVNNQGGGWGSGVATTRTSSGKASTNIVFRNLNVHECWGEGINLWCSNGFLVENCTVTNSWSIGIYMDSAQNGLVRSNTISCPNTAYQRNGGTGGVVFSTEYYPPSFQPPVPQQSNSNITIVNNLFLTGVGFGVNYWHDSAQTGSWNTYNDITIAYNTFVGNQHEAISLDSTSPQAAPFNIIIANNIVHKAKGYNDGLIQLGNPSAVVFHTNDYPDGVLSPYEPSGLKFAPNYVNQLGVALVDFVLSSTSPLISKGTPVAGISYDAFLHQRNPVSPTIGLWEPFSSSSSTKPTSTSFTINPTTIAPVTTSIVPKTTTPTTTTTTKTPPPSSLPSSLPSLITISGLIQSGLQKSTFSIISTASHDLCTIKLTKSTKIFSQDVSFSTGEYAEVSGTGDCSTGLLASSVTLSVEATTASPSLPPATTIRPTPTTVTPTPSTSSPKPSTNQPTSTPGSCNFNPNENWNPGAGPLCQRLFTSSSPWNRMVPANPQITSYSASGIQFYFQTMPGTPGFAVMDFENYKWSTDYSHPVYVGDPAIDPLYTISCTETSWGTCQLQGKAIPIPVKALPAGGTDHHMGIINKATGEEYDMWQFQDNRPVKGGSATCTFGGMANVLNGDGTGDPTTASGNALTAGVVRFVELMAATDENFETINHALFLVAPCTQENSVPPSIQRTTDSLCADGKGVPYGAWLHLALSSSQIAALNVGAPVKAIFSALSRYGGFISDTSNYYDNGGISITTESLTTYYAYNSNELQTIENWNGGSLTLPISEVLSSLQFIYYDPSA